VGDSSGAANTYQPWPASLLCLATRLPARTGLIAEHCGVRWRPGPPPPGDAGLGMVHASSGCESWPAQTTTQKIGHWHWLYNPKGL